MLLEIVCYQPLYVALELGKEKVVWVKTMTNFSLLCLIHVPWNWNIILNAFGKIHVIDHWLTKEQRILLWTLGWYFLIGIHILIHIPASHLRPHRILGGWLPFKANANKHVIFHIILMQCASASACTILLFLEPSPRYWMCIHYGNILDIFWDA